MYETGKLRNSKEQGTYIGILVPHSGPYSINSFSINYNMVPYGEAYSMCYVIIPKKIDLIQNALQFN